MNLNHIGNNQLGSNISPYFNQYQISSSLFDNYLSPNVLNYINNLEREVIQLKRSNNNIPIGAFNMNPLIFNSSLPFLNFSTTTNSQTGTANTSNQSNAFKQKISAPEIVHSQNNGKSPENINQNIPIEKAYLNSNITKTNNSEVYTGKSDHLSDNKNIETDESKTKFNREEKDKNQVLKANDDPILFEGADVARFCEIIENKLHFKKKFHLPTQSKKANKKSCWCIYKLLVLLQP